MSIKCHKKHEVHSLVPDTKCMALAREDALSSASGALLSLPSSSFCSGGTCLQKNKTDFKTNIQWHAQIQVLFDNDIRDLGSHGCLSAKSLNLLKIHSFMYSCVHSFIHVFIHSFIPGYNCCPDLVIHYS